MKAVRSRIFAFLMLGVIITLNTGMGLVEHTCLMSGKKSLSAHSQKSCCSKKSTQAVTSAGAATVKADNCCEVNTHYIQVDFVSIQEKISKVFSSFCFFVAEKLVNVFNLLIEKSETACSYTNSSPPVAGRTLLTKYCTLVV
jgi:hypothetical protein